MAAEEPRTGKPQKPSGGGKPGRRPAELSFPRDPLKRALKVAESIERNSAGRPYNRLDLAQSIELSPSSYSFRSILRSSSRYGLTEGSEKSDKIALTPLGTTIVAPKEEGESTRGLREALVRPPLFGRVLEFYDQKRIPPDELFENALKREFGLPPEDVNACHDVLATNLHDYGLIQNIKGTEYLKLDRLAASSVTTEEIADEQAEETSPVEERLVEEEADTTPPPTRPNEIFVAHGRSRSPLDQLKSILTQFRVPFKIAVDEPHKGRPIGEKVAQLMRSWGSR